MVFQMDRGTDPMDFEGEGSSGNPVNVVSGGPYTRFSDLRNCPFTNARASRLSSGTDEASASHSSTNFLTPPEVSTSEIPPVTQPLLATSSSDTSINRGASPRNETPARTYRFNLDMIHDSPFMTIRSRSSSVPRRTTPGCQASTPGSNGESSRTRLLSLTPNTTILFNESEGEERTNEAENGEMQRTEDSSTPSPSTQNPPSWTNRSNPSDGTGTSTEVNDSENEDQVAYEELQTESQSDDVPQSSTSRPNLTPSTNPPRSPRNSGSVHIGNCLHYLLYKIEQ